MSRFAAPAGTELVDRLGAGSVFDVARVREDGRVMVCKRLALHGRREAAARAALVREAKLLTLAVHPALPRLLRVGSDGHGPFVLETWVEGASARALVEGWEARGRGVPGRLVAHVAAAAAAALAELHALADEAGALGVVHGDLGPDHVILGPIGEARFVDLGAARFRGMEAALDTGDKGTLPFVAPEVARGEVAPDQAGDVYALAATLLFLATGGPLAGAREGGALLLEIGERGVRRELAERAKGLGVRGREALFQALAPHRGERLGTAQELAEALGGDPSIMPGKD